jgi:hypothetical protein
MQPLDVIFLQWTSVINPAWIMIAFSLTVAHAFLMTLVDNWL